MVKRFIGGQGLPESNPKLYLAACGKHPGWNDHIEDVGLETEAMVAFVQRFYASGVGGLNDTGDWTAPEVQSKLIPFHHVFVFQQGAEILLGLMWASTDGKGRSNYPMIVFAHSVGLALKEMVSTILPRLKSLRDDLKETNDAARVRELMDDAREDVRAAIAELDVVKAVNPWDPDLVKDGLADAELARPCIDRFLYQMEQLAGPFATGSFDWRRMLEDEDSMHLRLPLGGLDTAHSIQFWLSLVRTQIAEAAPVMLSYPIGENWCDCIIGSIKGSTLKFIRHSLAAMPPHTEITYNIPPESVDGIDCVLESWASEGEKKSIVKGVRRPPRVIEKAGRSIKSGNKNLWSTKKLVGIGGVGLALIAVAILLFVNSCSSQEEAATTVTTTTKPAAAPEDEALSKEIKANLVWYGPFYRYVNEDWRDAPAFKKAVLEPMEQIQHSDLEPLARSIDFAALDKETTQQSGRYLKRIRKAIITWWESTAPSEEVVQQLQDQGWDRLAEAVQDQKPLPEFDAELCLKIDERIRFNGAMKTFLPNLEEYLEFQNALEEQGHATANRVLEMANRQMKGPSSVSAWEKKWRVLRPDLREARDVITGASGKRYAWEFYHNNSSQFKMLGPQIDGIEELKIELSNLNEFEQLPESENPLKSEAMLALLEQVKGKVGQARKTPEPYREQISDFDAIMIKYNSYLTTPYFNQTMDKVQTHAKEVEKELSKINQQLNLLLSGPVQDWAETFKATSSLNVLQRLYSKVEEGVVPRDFAEGNAPFRMLIAEQYQESFNADTDQLREMITELFAEFQLRREDVPLSSSRKDELAIRLKDFKPGDKQHRANINDIKAGPERSGNWTKQVTKNHQSVLFTYNPPEGEPISVRFIRLNDSDKSNTFVMASEVSVGFFINWVNANNMQNDFLVQLPEWLKDNAAGMPPQEVRRGPYTWIYADGERLELSSYWQTDNLGNELALIPNSKGREVRPEMPMQYVSPQAATIFASSLHCRLPDAKEWGILVDNGETNQKPNLRDRTWSLQKQYILENNSSDGSGSKIPWPDMDIFETDEIPANPSHAQARHFEDREDDYVWFRETDLDSDQFQDVIGNVAEWIQNGDQYAIAGSSALSVPEMNERVLYFVNERDQDLVYSDVGFRLVFDLGTTTPDAEFREILQMFLSE